VERIFAAPDLSGPRLRQPKFSPDGRYVTYLQGKAENKDQLDLWGFDTRSNKARLLVDSKAFNVSEKLSAEEEARRERQRTASLSGIVDYEFSPDGKKLLVPLGGDLYLYNLNARGSAAVRRLTYAPAYETDARFSPEGRFVSFIRDQNLHVIDLATYQERALTTDGRGPVQNGVAEFVAQEEMDRDTGYWWSPDEKRIAFTRIDDTPVAEIERFEINADGAKAVRQRYPAAGTPNTRVELKVMEIAIKRVTNVELGLQDGYLARVSWFPDSRRLAVQRQTRDQKQLDLVRVDSVSGSTKVLLTETSKHWIDLNNDLQFLKLREGFVWASRRNGYKHLYLYDFDGKLIRPLTEGPWMVVGDGTETGLVGIDEARGLVYFMANEASVLERQLYSASLDTTTPYVVKRISLEPGVHDARLLPGAQRYLDVWSSPDQPPTASIRGLDGGPRAWLVRNLLDSSHPYTRFSGDRVKEQFGSIKSNDGQELFYRLIPPARALPGKRYPVIVDVYGGPHNQYVRKDWMGGARAAQGYFRQVLSQRGFAVFSLDNRGSGYRGDKFDAAIAGRLGKVEIEDQLAGVEFLKQQSFVDPKRIGIMGWSYGGYMTLMALTTTDAFKAGIAGAPVTDWRLYDTHYTERYIGMPNVGSSYEDSSVLKYASALRGSLLLVHGLADDNVLFTHSTLLMQRLQALDKSFDVMTYPGGKHGLLRLPQTGQHYYNMVVRFFERELKE
jgi:dipeptidyl-peptidase-4